MTEPSDHSKNQPAQAPSPEQPTVPPAKRLRDGLILLAKLGISAAIIAYLVRQAQTNQSFDALYHQPKQWGVLGLAFLSLLTGLSITIVRWYYLVRALNIPLSMRDAYRLGHIGYLFNFLSLGVIGGDALKSVFLLRQHPDHKTEAIATIVLDRVIGLFVLLAIGAWAFLAADLESLQVPEPDKLAAVLQVCRVMTGIVVVGGLVMALGFIPGLLNAKWLDRPARVPVVGRVYAKLLAAARIYQDSRGTLVFALAISFVAHLFNILSVYLVACGLPGEHPTLAQHYVIVPVALSVGSVPLPGGGGVQEYALDLLYQAVGGAEVARGQGFIIALGFRVTQLLVAGIGLIYFLAGRREVRKLMSAAEGDEVYESEVNPSDELDKNPPKPFTIDPVNT